jgi:RHS repeat-associated protein
LDINTDSTGAVTESIDYYPYGQSRIDTTSASFAGEKRKYIGEEYDSTSGLNYLNARYYDGNKGHFISEDPVFWEVGLTDDGRKVLQNPQLQNSYSYAGNNPITQKDPTGRCVWDACAVELTIASAPVWSPYAIAAGGIVAGWLGYQVGNAIKSNGDKLIETVQPTSYAELNFPRGGGDPNDFKDPRNGLSTLEKVLYFGVGGAAIADTICQQSSACKQFVDKFMPGNGNTGASSQNNSSKTNINPQVNNQKSLNSNSSSGYSNYFSAFSSAGSSLQRASAAISSGDYRSAQTYLSSASRALSSVR